MRRPLYVKLSNLTKDFVLDTLRSRYPVPKTHSALTRAIRNGDRIEIGDVALQFYICDFNCIRLQIIAPRDLKINYIPLMPEEKESANDRNHPKR